MAAEKYISKLARSLFSAPGEQELLISSLQGLPDPAPALVWLKDRPAEHPFPVLPPAAWQPDFVDRLPAGSRPGKSELHGTGSYYCFDLSSAFSASVVSSATAAPQAILDICSAPGGKGIFAWRALSPRLLFCNEVIGKRLPMLISNLERCHVVPAKVTSHDSKHFAAHAASAFDLVIADAPCSGQSLLVKGTRAPGCFHPATINMNSNRQKRIIANAASSVAPGGFLAYMTCTFSREENEAVVEWLLKKFPVYRSVEVPALNGHRSHLSEHHCYRLWPWSGEGAGAFAALLRREENAGRNPLVLDAFKIKWEKG